MNTMVAEKKTGLHWLWLTIIVILLDQLSKYLITQYLSYNTPVYLLSFLNLTLEYNKGAAFSLLSQVGDMAIWLFIVTALLVSTVLCVWLHRLPSNSRWLGISLSMILGGAIGNLLDRIFHGFVVDFIHLHVGEWSWPIFNVADIAITVGASMLMIDIFKKR